ncbi:MAG TPA: lytic transglycosylase domain-containing protein [Anaeromyxobacteraceae bacterium]|nr:lytic transglycosylase domain-containing protein [Anaeromyxobacteraceae bacterium]
MDVGGLPQTRGLPDGFVRRRRRGRAVLAVSGVVFAALLALPGVGGDGDRPLAPAEAELPVCPLGRACPDPGVDGWAARIETLLEARTPSLPETTRRRVARAVVEESRSAGIDPLLTAAIICVESAFDAAARSGRGASGLMQLRPETMAREAARHGMAAGDPHDPVVNVRLGIRYFARLVETFAREDRALMAYNAGPNRIGGLLHQGRIPTRFRAYPARVFAEHRRLRRAFGIEPATAVAVR